MSLRLRSSFWKFSARFLAVLPLATACILTSCRSPGDPERNFSGTDPIFRTFGLTLEDDGASTVLRLVSVYPRAKINAGIIKPNGTWEHEFILDTVDSLVEIGETFAECNAPMKISFSQDSLKSYRLKVSITPTGDQETLRCHVRIPVFRDNAEEQINLEINAVVGI